MFIDYSEEYTQSNFGILILQIEGLFYNKSGKNHNIFNHIL